MALIDKFNDASAETLITLARNAEQAERYEDMCEFVQKLVVVKDELGVEDRNLLSVAFKNVVGTRRAAWRTLNSLAEDDKDETDTSGGSSHMQTYKSHIEAELIGKCDNILKLLNDTLLKKFEGKGDENEVFYSKMAGDYYRYLAEISNENQENGKKAEAMYQKAMDAAKEALTETHPTRLGLALNFSVCYYEILKDSEKAIDLAKQTFDDAISKLDTLDDESYRDSTLIMQLLRDNLTLWTNEAQNNDE